MQAWMLIAAPFALFHACAYFYQTKKLISSFLFILAIGYILYMQYGTATAH